MLPPPWLRDSEGAKPIQEECSFEKALEYNAEGYGVYWYPNHPSLEAFSSRKSHFVQAADIDTWEWVILDLDMKDYQSDNPDRRHDYKTKEDFLEVLFSSECLPTRVIDSGGGVHAYWRATDLDAMSFLRLSRRVCRKFHSDPAVAMIKQLMRVPGTVNTKREDNFVLCDEIYASDTAYTCEQIDKWLPPITAADEAFCKQHYDRAYNPEAKEIKVNEKLPLKFKKLLAESKEAKELFAGDVSDRSAADWRLAHLMLANGFTKEEAMSVLVNVSKALERSPQHRVGYAENICDKVWSFEESSGELDLSDSVKSILAKSGDEIKGTRIPCHPAVDNTEHGFRLGQVIGLVAGSGVGKTSFALNMFRWFAQRNPDMVHFFVPLEQKREEIAERWVNMCQGNDALHEKVHVLSNYSEDGNYRHLSMSDIQEYLVKFQQTTKRKVGVVVIDHIGVLKKQSKDGENQGLIDICHEMKAVAVRTNTLLIMQSQAPREKAGIGDIELNKDAAYGTVFFESYCDFLITLWQPVKRCYSNSGCPTVMSYKFCKIRKKRRGVDVIHEDVPYYMFFDPSTERLRQMTQDEEESFKFWDERCRKLRSADRKTDPVTYTKIEFDDQESA